MTSGNNQSISGAYAKIEAHEDKCDLRHQTIQSTLTRLESNVDWILRGMVAVLVALVGWLGVQVYNGVKSPAQAAERHAARVP
jgi:cytochrome c-type biogenesis protein CcmH/NrfG